MQSWEDIYHNQAPRLLGLCRRYVRDISLAEDLMHDAFLTAINKQNSYNGSGPVEAWLRKITLNTVLQYLRQEKRLMEYQQEDAPELPEAFETEDTDDPLQLLLNAGLDKADLQEALDQLPDHHRVVFNLYVLEGYTHPQIAAELRISVGTSKSHLSRARKKIQVLLLSKVQAMQQKKRRAALLFFPFLRQREHPIDQLYKDALKHNPLPPGKTLPKNLAEALHKAPPLATPPALAIGWKGLSGLGLFCLAGVGIWWFAGHSRHDSRSTSAPASATPIITEMQNDTNTSVPATAPLPAQVPEQPKQRPETSNSAAVAKTGKPVRSLSAPTKAGTAPPPVVVRKKVLQKDTLYQFTKPGTNNEH